MNIEERIKRQEYPEYIVDEIIRVYSSAPDIFEKELRKAENNSSRPGIMSKYDIWIAANNADLKLKSRINPANLSCYYCHDILVNYKVENIRFEHFIPKLQIPANIVPSCHRCDEFKADRFPKDFEAIVINESVASEDKKVKSKYGRRRLVEFSTLVACHSFGSTNPIWIDKMIELASRHYKVDLLIIPKGRVRWEFYELYRSHWHK